MAPGPFTPGRCGRRAVLDALRGGTRAVAWPAGAAEVLNAPMDAQRSAPD